MKKQKLFYKIYFSFLLILIPFTAILALYITYNFRNFFYVRTREELIRFTGIILDDVTGRVFSSDHASGKEAETLSKYYGELSGFRITIILKDGEVIGDSAEDPEIMENHAGRPEVREAVSGRIGYNIRFSDTLKENMFYAARPVSVNGAVTGILRSAVSIASLNDILASLWFRIGLGSLIMLGLSGFLALWISKRISRPLEQLTKGVEEYRQGNLVYHIKPSRISELDMLSTAMNSMASELKERISLIMHQRSLDNAIFSTMIEGIVALDNNRHCILINRSAEKILAVEFHKAYERRFEEIIRTHVFLEFITRACGTGSAVEDVLQKYDHGEFWYNVHGIPLIDENAVRFGTLIVIYDITKLKRLEKIRKDFAVNVSHEFKTPLTVIRGYVETIMSLHRETSGDTSRFLKIIEKETERLNAIIDDLMSLARIERDGETREILFYHGNIRDICTAAIKGYEEKALEKGIKIGLDCPDDLAGVVNRGLLVQALANLIDNAIKYSYEHSIIQVEAVSAGDEIVISVKDQGCGIPAEHQGRIFERFYRVDKGRDRKTGGTGLGLALVKHIALVHSGRVEVKSTVGAGSTFTMYIKKDHQ